MAAVAAFYEDNGAQTGSPLKGTTRAVATQMNWKSIDDIATAYATSPITRGGNSYTKYQFIQFSGTFNSIGAGLWAHTAGAMGTGLTIKGVVGTTYATPATAANAALTVDMTTVIAIGSGQAVLFGATGPEAAGKATSSAANPCFSEYLPTQLQTTVSATTGDTATAVFTAQWSES